MALKRYDRYSAHVIRSARWKTVRLQAKRRDGFKCVACGSRLGLEVDHIEPVRKAPERAYDLSNLQTLCGSCHARKTRLEIGLGHENPQRDAWRAAVKELSHAKERSCSNP